LGDKLKEKSRKPLSHNTGEKLSNGREKDCDLEGINRRPLRADNAYS